METNLLTNESLESSKNPGIGKIDAPSSVGWGLLWFGALVGFLTLWILVYPFNFQGHGVYAWLSGNRFAKLNTLCNVLLFMPYGMVVAWIGAGVLKGWRGRTIVLLVVLDAALLSLLGETAQVWLPERESSLVDIGANALGGLIGAMAGWHWAGELTARWRVVADWLAKRPVARRAVLVVVCVMVARTAPFDISPETRYLRLSLYETRAAGGPMSAVMAWHRDTTGDPVRRAMARGEMVRVIVNFVLFGAMVIAVGLAVQESAARFSDRSYPFVSIVLGGVLLVLATELLQWPIRSRLMDASDAAAGLVGVCGGAVVGGMIHWIRFRGGSPSIKT